MNPFEFLNCINETKKDVIAEEPDLEKEYSPFMVNRGLSYFYDSVLWANAMNQHHQIPKKWQFQFLLNSIPRKKRFSKWHKRTEDKSLKLVMEFYNYSSDKAKQALSVLTDEQLKTIEEKLKTGGKR